MQGLNHTLHRVVYTHRVVSRLRREKPARALHRRANQHQKVGRVRSSSNDLYLAARNSLTYDAGPTRDLAGEAFATLCVVSGPASRVKELNAHN